MKTYIKTVPDAVIEKAIQEKLDIILADEKFCEHLSTLGFNNEAIKENISFVIDYYNDYNAEYMYNISEV